MAASDGKDKDVYCTGSGPGGSLENGDTCKSEAGIYRTVGLTTLANGLAAMVVGGVYWARKPVVETKVVGARQLSRVAGTSKACGIPGSLEGMTLAVALPQAGTWTGSVARDGSARIDIAPDLTLPEATVRVVVQSVPASAAGLVSPGLAVGEVQLVTPKPATAPRPPSTKRKG
jgi:hypothetical protein